MPTLPRTPADIAYELGKAAGQVYHSQRILLNQPGAKAQQRQLLYAAHASNNVAPWHQGRKLRAEAQDVADS